MSLTKIQVAEAVEGAEFLFQHIQAKDLPTVQVEAAQYGANIINCGSPFVLKDQPPVPVIPPNPPVPAPVLTGFHCTPDQKKSFERAIAAMRGQGTLTGVGAKRPAVIRNPKEFSRRWDKDRVKAVPNQVGSMLSVLLAALWPQILAALEAILKNVITPPAPAQRSGQIPHNG